MVGSKVVSVVLSLLLVLTAFPFTGFAAPVNREIASDPVKVLAEIEAMNLPDMPDEVAEALRGEGWYVLYGFVAQLASWCITWCQPVYDYIDAFLQTADVIYAQLPKGTPVYSGTAQSTPIYYKR